MSKIKKQHELAKKIEQLKSEIAEILLRFEYEMDFFLRVKRPLQYYQQYVDEQTKIDGLERLERDLEFIWERRTRYNHTEKGTIYQAHRKMKSLTHLYTQLADTAFDLVEKFPSEYWGDAYAGLISAAKRFDLNKGKYFNIYAFHWCRSHVQRAIFADQLIQLPKHYAEIQMLIDKYEENFAMSCLPYDSSDIVQDYDINESRLQMYIQYAQSQCVSLERGVIENTFALNCPENVDQVLDLHAVASSWRALIRTDATSLEDDLFEAQRLDVLKAAFSRTLTERQQYVLHQRYGLDEFGEARTLGQVGQQMGLSRERVRQIELEALKRLEEWIRGRR